MSDDTVLENNVTPTDFVVPLPADKYQAMVRTLQSQNIKLRAMKNLHQIIQSKDHELKASQEKSENLQAALDRAEMRLANQIRLAVTSNSCKSVSGDSAVHDALFTSQTSPRLQSQTVSKDRQEPAVLRASDLETDCATLIESSPEGSSKLHGRFLLMSSSNISDTKVPTLKPEGLTHSAKDDSFRSPVTLQTRGLKSSPSSMSRSDSKTEVSPSLDSAEKVLSTTTTSVKSIGAVGVSKDLLDKLIQQNARLKKVIRDILKQQGSSVEKHLEQEEMRDVVKQLRDDLRLSKAQNERLKEMLNTRDSDDVMKKYATLSENCLKQKKMIAMLQTMADAYNKDYEKQKQENKELKEQLTACTMKQKSAELPDQTDFNGTTQTSGNLQSSSSSSSLHKNEKLQLDEALQKLRDTETRYDTLRLQYQQLSEMLEEKSQCLAKAEDDLKQQGEMFMTEKEVLQKQIDIFQEDFNAERRENTEKQQQFETTLAKHQDWLRKLVSEAQRCRSLYEEEKGKREKAETDAHEVQTRFRSYIEESRSSSSSCRKVENWLPAMPVLKDLEVDHACDTAASLSLDSLQRRTFGPASDEGEEDQEGALVCPRCEREFDAKDQKKWREHCARCTDD